MEIVFICLLDMALSIYTASNSIRPCINVVYLSNFMCRFQKARHTYYIDRIIFIWQQTMQKKNWQKFKVFLDMHVDLHEFLLRLAPEGSFNPAEDSLTPI